MEYLIHLPEKCTLQLSRYLSKPSHTIGYGWQTLVRDLGARTTLHIETRTATLRLEDEFIHRLIPPAVKYGSGGYQSLIRWILCLLLEQHRAVLVQAPASRTKASSRIG